MTPAAHGLLAKLGVDLVGHLIQFPLPVPIALVKESLLPGSGGLADAADAKTQQT